LLALHELEARGLRATLAGQRSVAAKLNEEVIARASEHGYAVVEARGVAMHALRKLEDLENPESALALARRSHEIVRASRASPGVHVIFASRAETEALLRLGRTDEALAALDELSAYTKETGLPPIGAMTTLARARYLAGRYESLDAAVAELRGCEVPSLRAICRATASYVEAMRLLASSEEPEETVAAFERAANEARGWNFLLRDVLVFGATAHVLVGSEAEARGALRRAQRLLDRMPSPWASAHLMRAEGTIAAAHGHWRQARQLLEAASGTFESGGDLTDAALAKHVMSALAHAFDEPDADERSRESAERLVALGLKAPGAVRVGVARVLAARRADASMARAGDVERLVAPLRRVAVRGADPALVQRELVAIASELMGARPARLEEIDANGEAHAVAGAHAARAEGEAPKAFEWVELGDGTGRRLRLGAEGPLDEHARAVIAVLATTGGLALEVASLRNTGASRADGATNDEDTPIPGLVAASPAMRSVRAEIARLAVSRATVVIHGEPGAGKESIARAIHAMSTRAKMPFVAFDCAAAPLDLFEGQLFGHRRGAFPGATRDQPGALRAAEGGTIFLADIGALPLDVQPKLLRFLESGEILPLGEKRPSIVDVRVLAATHRDLAALVAEQRFRDDLYYRLQVVTLRVPPLRDRREDIAPLTRQFLRELATSASPPVLAPDAIAKLVAYDFPGNVPELRSVIERALAYSPAPRVLRAEHLQVGS
jgi:hypothetical protein